MTTAAGQRRYKPTEARYKGRAREMYVTYDLPQRTRGAGQALYPKVKRVYIAGDVKDWKLGTFAKRTGKEVRGVKIDFEQTRSAYDRRACTASRGGRPPARTIPSTRSEYCSAFGPIGMRPIEMRTTYGWRRVTRR